MKKIVAIICLSFMLFLDICPKTLAAGIDRVDVLSDGTVLTYVSTERIGEFRQGLVERINRNRERKFSTGENLAMKAASATAGALVCWAESHVKNKNLRRGLMTATALITSAVFFYPEYIKYDVDQVENHRLKTELYYTNSGSYDRFSFDKKQGLNGLLACLDQSMMDLNERFRDTGMIVCERPYNVDKGSSYISGVYKQDPYDATSLNSSIEMELRNLRLLKQHSGDLLR